MYKLLLAFMVVVIGCMASCKTKPKAEEPVAAEVTLPDTLHIGNYVAHIDTVNEADFLKLQTSMVYDTSEAVNIARDSQLVHREGDTLFFKTDAAKEVTLANRFTEDDSYSRFEYCGLLGNTGQYLTYGMFYEWFNCFLISQTTGDTTELWGKPEVSPDGKFIMAVNADIEAGFNPNGIQLFKVDGGKLKLLGNKEIANWGPEEVRWVNAHEVLIKRQFLSITTTSSYRYDYVKLSFTPPL